MIRYHTFKQFVVRLCGLSIGLVGCGEAPRDNPLDPLSPHYNSRGHLLVHTQTYYSPNQPLAGVSLLLAPANLVQITDARGQFLFRDLPADTYRVRAMKPGFAADSQEVVVLPQRTAEIFLQLNALPAFPSISVRSENISTWIPITGETLQLVVEARVTDADGLDDIREVKLYSQRFGFLQDLQRSGVDNRFVAVIREEALAPVSLFDLVGERLWLEARDLAGALSVSDPVHLVRIIESTPLVSEPSGLKVTSPRPRFQWVRLRLPFEYRYRIDLSVFNISFPLPVPLRQVDDISSDSSAFVYDSVLSSGAYVWTLSVIDRFSNLSRSREAVFEVK
ncbi:MAG: carboxypeptidase-like regulatory domain-containing protein [candidate division KSB1 bacterium]|nr:carboxypeptidase-like regulatory domain-containing protein [candidate division KSB1 bacterium]MDZ7274820.1 carboxypeptidase-like regulatory domain-containing protein [candidate division KSB1 bacterium]MDZ7285645.1 carboxypeptidase-like regulatory domain-containing protein [candidate division KSB1 bacterium]MDZ7298677.1 carboxypeptidase-like regulatory domain-containing protein [candidate division KSB1 bacterium]MDZ7308415.1 carboxypeptidase-like regulatory domain-containing protein [candidat